MRNPVIEYRDEHAMTQQELADRCDVTVQVIKKVEQGMFNYVPPSISEYIGESDLDDKYHAWLASVIDNVRIDLPPVGSVSTFVRWRTEICPTRYGFCKLLKIQPVIISNYENGRTKELPALLGARLTALGIEDSYIEWVKGLPRHG